MWMGMNDETPDIGRGHVPGQKERLECCDLAMTYRLYCRPLLVTVALPATVVCLDTVEVCLKGNKPNGGQVIVVEKDR